MYEDAVSRADLIFKIKLLRDRVDAFESGEHYQRMKALHKKARAADARTIKNLERELFESRRETIRVRNLWYAVCEDIRKECDKELKEKDAQLNRMEKELQKAYALLDAEHEKSVSRTKDLYAVKSELEDEREKNHALTARINKDHTNSSKPSSADPNHDTIHNSREKTGRKPGGQSGHEHHPRKRQEPTRTEEIAAPEEYLDTLKYKPTGKKITKQLIIAHVVTEVIDYVTPEFYNRETGQRIHAAFPPGVTDDVNYDGTVRAFAYMLNNGCNVSIDKTRRFLKDVSRGKIDISNGMICNLSKQFSKKTEKERDEIYQELLSAPTMHADFTFGRVNGKQGAVIITATPDGTVLYQAREKKGDEGVKGSPLEFYEGTLVSDHESAIIKHGKRHQECLAHIRRYMQGSIDNEPDLKWNSRMLAWITKAIHYWNKVNKGIETYDQKKADAFIAEYDEIIELAKDEYEYEPPSDYYKDGYNTFIRMSEDRERYILFLQDPSVPPTNNLAERSARRYKRKSAQVMSFRSQNGSTYFCDGLSITESLKSKGTNLFEEITERFNR